MNFFAQKIDDDPYGRNDKIAEDIMDSRRIKSAVRKGMVVELCRECKINVCPYTEVMKQYMATIEKECHDAHVVDLSEHAVRRGTRKLTTKGFISIPDQNFNYGPPTVIKELNGYGIIEDTGSIVDGGEIFPEERSNRLLRR